MLEPNVPEVKPAEESSAPAENVPSPEVKLESVKTEEVKPEEVKPEVKPAKTAEELQTQIDNLNVALKQERDISKTKVDSSKVEELENQLKESQETIGKLKNVFVPETPPEETPPDTLTKEQLEDFWKEKSEEETQKRVEEKRTELIQGEIKELSEKWNGEEGKPKYDDKEILQWQQEKQCLHLTPKQAFREKYENELIDYEVKQRLAGKTPVENVEQPSAQTGNHIPPEVKPQTEAETRAAVLEAMEKAEAEV